MEFLLPKRFLVLLLVLVALAGAVYLADGQRRAAVMDTVWDLADRVAALIVPGDMESMGGGQAGGQTFAMVPVVTSTFTPPVMSATEYERERAREEMPTATPTATPTPMPVPTPTPPPTPEPEVMGAPKVIIKTENNDITVTAIMPPVRRIWYEYNTKAGRWEKRIVLESLPIQPESIELLAIAYVPTPTSRKSVWDPQLPDTPDLDLRTEDSYTVEGHTLSDARYELRIKVHAPLEPGFTYLLRFSAWSQVREITDVVRVHKEILISGGKR